MRELIQNPQLYGKEKMDKEEIKSEDLEVWQSISLALDQAPPGSFIFIEADSPPERETFLDRIKQYKIKRTISYLKVNKDLSPLDPLFRTIPEWLKNRENSRHNLGSVYILITRLLNLLALSPFILKNCIETLIRIREFKDANPL